MSMDLENGIGITDEEIEYTDDELDEILGREHTDGPDLSDESEPDGDDEGEDEEPEEEKKVSFSPLSCTGTATFPCGNPAKPRPSSF